MPEFNINNKVRVKLTDRGRAALEADHIALWASAGRSMPYTPPKEDAQGWSEWQLWTLMNSLGGHMALGFENVIETTIQLEPFDAADKPNQAQEPLTAKQIDALFQNNKSAICALEGGSEHVRAYRGFLVSMVETAHGITANSAKGPAP